MIRILLKSHSINYRDREGPLAAQNTKWLPNRRHPLTLGRVLGPLCDLGCALPSLGLPVHQLRLCLPSPAHPGSSFSSQAVASGWAREARLAAQRGEAPPPTATANEDREAQRAKVTDSQQAESGMGRGGLGEGPVPLGGP